MPPVATAVETVAKRHQDAEIEEALRRLLTRTTPLQTPARPVFDLTEKERRQVAEADDAVGAAWAEVEAHSVTKVIERKRELRRLAADPEAAPEIIEELSGYLADIDAKKAEASGRRRIYKARAREIFASVAIPTLDPILARLETVATKTLSAHLAESLEDSRCLGIAWEVDKKAQALGDAVVHIRRSRSELVRERRQPSKIIEGLISNPSK